MPIELNRSRSPEILVFSFIRSTLYLSLIHIYHIEGAVKAVELALTDEELAFLEEPYVPHNLVGVMAQNTPVAAKDKHVWSIGSQKI